MTAWTSFPRMGPTRVSELKDGHVNTWKLDPKDLGLPYARLSDLQVELSTKPPMRCKAYSLENPDPCGISRCSTPPQLWSLPVRHASCPMALKTAANAIDSGNANRTLELLIQISSA